MQCRLPCPFLQTEYRHAVCLATVCSLPAALQGENSQSAKRKGAKLIVPAKWPNPREISCMMARWGTTVAGALIICIPGHRAMLRFHFAATWTTASANFACSGANSAPIWQKFHFWDIPCVGIDYMITSYCYINIIVIMILIKFILYPCPCHQMNMKTAKFLKIQRV